MVATASTTPRGSPRPTSASPSARHRLAIETADVVLMRSDPSTCPPHCASAAARYARCGKTSPGPSATTPSPAIAAGVFEPAFGLTLRPEIAAITMAGSSLIVAVTRSPSSDCGYPAPQIASPAPS